MVIHGPSTSFPVYKHDPAKRAGTGAGAGGSGSYKRAAPEHFDAAGFEKRYRGAGFYQFSQDDGVRRQQMEELRRERDETLQARRQVPLGDRSDAAPLPPLSPGRADTAADLDRTRDLGERRREARRLLVERKKCEIIALQQRLLLGDDNA